MQEIIKIGISSCLLGNSVRYDGEHQHDRYITETFGRYFEFVPVCPEVECGLGVPREAIQLQGDPKNPRLVTRKTGIDVTEQMLSWAAQKMKDLEKEELHGFIFKGKSPSCGMERVKVFGPDNNKIIKNGIGIFAGEFMRHFPAVPAADDRRLHDRAFMKIFSGRIATSQ